MSKRRSRTRRVEKIFKLDSKIFYTIVFSLLIIIIMCCVVIFLMNKKEKEKVLADKERVNQEQEKIFEATNEEMESLKDYKTDSMISFSAVGDILYNDNYNNMFTDIKKYLLDSDFVLGTYETKVEDNFIKSLKSIGFNYLSLAHNHAMDNGEKGLLELDNKIRENQISTVGVYSDKSEDRVKIVEKKNVKIAFLAYTYDNNKKGVNIYSDEIVKEDLKYAKENADISIVMMHWGNVNTNEITKEQERQADYLIENGANVIIGAHPSCIQKMEIKKNTEGKDCFVAYSLGDFTSNFNNENANLELILNFKMYVDKEKNVYLYKVDYTPVYLINNKILDMKNEIQKYDTEDSNIDKKTYDKLVRGIDRLRNIIK